MGSKGREALEGLKVRDVILRWLSVSIGRERCGVILRWLSASIARLRWLSLVNGRHGRYKGTKAFVVLLATITVRKKS